MSEAGPHHPGRAPLVRAFLLAPLAAPAAYAAALLGFTLVRVVLGSASLPSASAVMDLVQAVAVVGVPLAYGATLVAGVPAYLLLRGTGTLARWTLWLGGTAIGVAVALLLAPQQRGELFSIRFPWWSGGALGLVSADAFWRLLTRPRSGAARRHGGHPPSGGAFRPAGE